MKCEHCGKNEVAFMYRSNVNGHVEEKRLCSECAEKLGYTRRLANCNQRMLQDFLGGSFFGGSLLDDFFAPMPRLLDRSGWGWEDPFADFFREMPALGEREKAVEPAPEEKKLLKPEEESYFTYLRKRNALRMELKKAVRQEEFERAAQLRDELRALEAEHKDEKESA